MPEAVSCLRCRYTKFSFAYALRPTCTNVSTQALANAFNTRSPLPCLDFAVSITNVGRFDSDYVTLTFARMTPHTSTATVPLRSLCAFTRTHVSRAQPTTAQLSIDLSSAFSVVSSAGERQFVAGDVEFSSADGALVHRVAVTGAPTTVYALP